LSSDCLSRVEKSKKGVMMLLSVVAFLENGITILMVGIGMGMTM